MQSLMCTYKISTYSTAQVQCCTRSHEYHCEQQKISLKSGCGTCFNRESSSHYWTHENLVLKWVPHQFFDRKQIDVALGWYHIYKLGNLCTWINYYIRSFTRYNIIELNGMKLLLCGFSSTTKCWHDFISKKRNLWSF